MSYNSSKLEGQESWWDRLGGACSRAGRRFAQTAALLQNRIGVEGVRAFAADVVPVLDTGIDQAFCFDPHFTEQGFAVLPRSPA